MAEFNPNREGVDHININRNARSALGRLLHPASNLPLNHPEHGKFASLENFRMWINTGMSVMRLRHVPVNRAIEIAQTLPRGNVSAVAREDLLCEGLGFKIEQNEELAKLLRECKLPIVAYHVHRDGDSNLVVSSYAQPLDWMLQHLALHRHCC